MKTKIILASVLLLIFTIACKSKQKNSVTPSAPPLVLMEAKTERPANGVYAPGPEEVGAIQAQFKGTTQQELMQGYKLYTGECTSCHQPKNIYNRAESQWPRIIGEMSMRSHLNTAQSDAILKYVLSVKALQSK